ncbi:MAG: glycosyltransferase [Bacteroidales bacterium]|nr:glycosyltransferase [Bacteroidales bacterium]
MEKRVLIIGPNFYNFCSAVKYAFEQHGYITKVDSYDTPIHPYTSIMKWKYKLSANKAKLKQKSRLEYSCYIEELFDNYKPDIVFILNGDILTSKTLDYFRGKAKVVLWFFDSITRYPEIVNHVNHADYTFCYEKTDVDYYAKKGIKTYFLPQACDINIYKPLNHIEKDIDILFVGDLYNSKKRQSYMKAVVAHFQDKKIKVFGIYKPWYKNPIKCLLREKRNIYANHIIPSTLVNEYYNRSKLVLNIHHEQQVCGANPKVYEISGSGAYQVCDYNPFLKEIYPNEEISFYTNETELVNQIQEVLTTKKWKESNHACRIVRSHHSYTERIEYVLETINE